MNVLYVNEVSELSGAEKVLLNIIATIKDKGMDPVVACPKGLLSEELRKMDVLWENIHLRKLGRTLNPFYLIDYIYSYFFVLV